MCFKREKQYGSRRWCDRTILCSNLVGGTVRIGRGLEIGERCRVLYYIGEGSYIGINVVIVGNVKIGKRCVIGANSVVIKDVPYYCVVVGSSARVIRTIEKK